MVESSQRAMQQMEDNEQSIYIFINASWWTQDKAFVARATFVEGEVQLA